MQELTEVRINYGGWGDKIKEAEARLDTLLSEGWRVYSSQLFTRKDQTGTEVLKIHFLERQTKCSPSITASTL
jgi:hypothetical protein